MDDSVEIQGQVTNEIKIEENEFEIDLSKKEFDMKTLDGKVGFNSDSYIENVENRIHKDKDSIYDEVLADTKWYGDSFEMSQIKEEIRNLKAILNLGIKAEPEALLLQYNRMIEQAEQYIAAKDSKMSFYTERHQKVRTLLEHLREKREVLTVNNRQIEELADVRQHRNVGIELLHDDECQEDTLSLLRGLVSAVPAERQEFEAKKKSIMNDYQKLIRRVKGISNSFCIFSAAKKRKQAAKRQLAQLEKEFAKFSALSFDTMKPDQVFCTWENNYDYPVVELDDMFVKQHPGIQYSGPEYEDGYRILSNMLDVRELFVVGDRKVKSGDEEYYILPEAQGITIDAAYEKAEELGLPLMYSEEAAEQLQNIQIIDFIMGQTNRNEESFEVKCGVKNIENVDYLVITDVKVRDHSCSLSEESPEELNKAESSIRKNKKQLYVEMDKLNEQQKADLAKEQERQFADKGDQILITGYNYALADRIIDLDEKRLLGYFRSLGMEDKVVDAVGKRLEKVKALLKEDRDEGFRHRREEQAEEIKKNKMQGYMRVAKRKKLVLQSKYSYIHSGLVQDTGSQDYDDVKEINRKDSDKVKSVQSVYEKFDRLKINLNADKEKLAGIATKEETLEVLKAIEEYGDCDFDWERLETQGIHVFEWKELMERFEPERVSSFQGDDADKLFFEKEGDPAQYFECMRSVRLRKALNAIKLRIGELEKKQKKDDYDNEELAKLTEYLHMLDHNTKGELVVPPNTKVKKVKDTQFTSDYTFKDARDIELFPEKPMLSDLIQGNIGNCYLIATLGSVLEADPTFIQKHMKDNGDGTVTVKLYTENFFGEGYSPTYVTVDKTIAYNNEGRMVGSMGALWVKLYEKAIAAAGIKQSFFSAYNINLLDGGNSQDALGWITGKRGKDDLENLSTGGGETCFQMPSNWKYRDKKTNKIGYTNTFLHRVENVKKKLKKMLDRKAIVVAGAFRNLAGSPGVGKNGENVRRGIAGQHSYTVLNMEEINGETYVRIRNPWGVGVVETVQNELTGKIFIREADSDIYHGSCLLHINTFVEHCYSLNYVLKGDVEGMK